jgi:hypothetical protein
MAELLGTAASWPSLLLVLLVFGLAPGFCLRLIVLAYPRSDPRRAELIAELYAVPRIERPHWVVEQLEIAISEGLAHRVTVVIRALTARRRQQPNLENLYVSHASNVSSGLWVTPCCNALVQTIGDFMSRDARDQRCAKCSQLYTVHELVWSPTLPYRKPS